MDAVVKVEEVDPLVNFRLDRVLSASEGAALRKRMENRSSACADCGEELSADAPACRARTAGRA